MRALWGKWIDKHENLQSKPKEENEFYTGPEMRWKGGSGMGREANAFPRQRSREKTEC